MEVRPAGWALSGVEGSSGEDDSVTDVGEPALVRAASLEIARGAVLAGRYQVEAIIGKGGSGIVLRAFDRVAQIPVAMKILKPELAQDPRWLERFSRELRLARQIQHPNVCRVFDIAEADGHWFLTMELATSGTLRDSIAPGAPARSLAQKTEDARGCVAGLAAIHAVGIVHRDIKPDNLLRMSDGRLVLSDFGLATNPAETPAVSILVGTPTYMAPEVVVGEPATTASDVWSLGVVLHEILFGRRPQWASSRNHGRVVQLPAAPDRSRTTMALTAICSDCLREDPASRPADARDIAEGIEAIVSGRRRLGKRRRSPATWTVPVVALGLILFAVTTGRWWSHAAAINARGAADPSYVQVQGKPSNWSDSKILASMKGPIHCLDWIDGGRGLRVVRGVPRQAIDIDLATKKQTPARIAERMYQVGCPETSSKGEVLYQRYSSSGRVEIAVQSPSTDGAEQFLTYGTAPVWHPNGSEFAFNIDGAHAGVFSVPTAAVTLIADALPAHAGDTYVVDKAFSADGARIVLKYMDESYTKYLVSHDFPSLRPLGTATVDRRAKELAVGSGADQLIFAYDEGDSSTLVKLTAASPIASRLGFIPGRYLRKPTFFGGSLAFDARTFYSDVWLEGTGQRTERITSDGKNYNADRSQFGGIIVEHAGPDASMVVRIYAPDGTFRDVTKGPSDHTPSFLPDGHGWVYVDGMRRAIVRCAREGQCRPMYIASELPLFPVSSPDEKRLAFITAANSGRLVMLNASGEARDFGPARSDCSPRWSASDRIWVLLGSEAGSRWVELDVGSGAKTGREMESGPHSDDTYNCPYPADPLGSPLTRRAVAHMHEEAEIRVRQAD
jgi:serine/threonine protein kinase